MKKIYYLLLGLLLFTDLYAQPRQNDLKVVAILSPTSNQTYSTVDTFDIVIEIINLGPNTIISADSLQFNYSIDNGTPASRFFDTLLTVGNRELNINEKRTYTLQNQFIINDNSIYSACASISGTVIYPINTNKLPGKCEQFFVNLQKESIGIEKMYYTGNELIVASSIPTNDIRIYDITGKLILSLFNIKSKNLTIPFEQKTKGFYFATVTDANGNQATAKFVVSQ